MSCSDVILTSVKYYCLKFDPRRPVCLASHTDAAAASVPRSAKDSNSSAVVDTALRPRGGERFAKSQKDLMELCKRRFFYRPAFDIYGGVAGFFTYGPPGCAVKNNIIRQWRQHFVIEEGLLEVEDTCIMQHAVLKASGHVDRFNDFMVKDLGDESKFFRADKLLEECMDEKLKAEGLTDAERSEYMSVRNQADAYSQQELGDVFKRFGIKSPETGNDLSDPFEFNLMFPTPIGPGGYLQGYLRPETAQGIFLNYKFCCEQNSNRLPFGVAQVGRAFRNEIAPRAGLTRQREFTQAEIEYFVNPSNKAHPKFKNVEGVTLLLFHSNEQLAAKDPVRMTVGDAVGGGVINNETLGYFIVRTYMFLLSVGVDKHFVRFRQHLPTEMAHYACDCWDAEIYTSYGWLECVGIADRSAFDLNAHSRAAKCDLQYKETLEKPIEKEVLQMTKASGVAVMKAFKKDGKMVKEWIEARAAASDEVVSLAADERQVTINEQVYELKPEFLQFERVMEKQTVHSFTPGVIEPSFGIDRIFSAVLEHIYYTRPKEENADDKQTRGVLAFTGISAPYKCAILPLDQRVARHERYLSSLQTFRAELSALGLSYTIDESGAAIGRRYARNDELGIPFAVTFDFKSLEDDTVTLRERDRMEQIRLSLRAVAELVWNLCAGESGWEASCEKFSRQLVA